MGNLKGEIFMKAEENGSVMADIKRFELRFAALTTDWNDGMLEKWNNG
jgi:hypothetical protein